MEAVIKSELLDAMQLRVENHLQQAIGVFQNMDEFLLNAPAPDGGWSIAQCLEHLNIYGDYYLPAIEKGIESSGDRPSDLFKSSRLGSYFTSIMEPGKKMMKFKAFKDYIPSEHLNAHAVVARFISQQEMLLALLNRSADADLNRIKIPVSIAKFIRLKLGDVFGFIIAHNERHILQANRNIY